MVFYNINKKAFFAATIVLVLVSVLISSIEVQTAFNLASAVEDKTELSIPELNSDFPTIFLKAFILDELSDLEKEKLGLNVDSRILVRDVLHMSGEDFEEVMENRRDSFLEEYVYGDNIEVSVTELHRANFNEQYSDSDLLKLRFDSVSSNAQHQKLLLSLGNPMLFYSIDGNNFNKIYFKSVNSHTFSHPTLRAGFIE